MADYRRTRDYQPDSPLDLQFLNDPRYTPLDRIGMGMGGAGNEASYTPPVDIDQRMANIEELGALRTQQENQLEALRNASQSRGMGLGDLWQGIKDAGSSGMDMLGRGLNAITPTQQGYDNFAMRLQNANAIVNGGTPLYMMQQQQQIANDQNQQMLAFKRQQMADQLRMHQQTMQQNQWEDVFKVLGSNHLSPPQQMQLLKNMSQSNPQAATAAQSVNEKMLGKFRTYEKYLPRTADDYMAGLKSGAMNWDTIAADLDVAESTAKEETKSLAMENAQQKKIQGLIDKLHSSPETLSETELGLLDKYNTAKQERALKIQELQGSLSKQAFDLNKAKREDAMASVMPQYGPEVDLAGGFVQRDRYDPQTGQLTTVKGNKPPASVTHVNMKQESAFEQELGKENVKDVKGTQAKARESAAIIQNIHQGRQLLDSGMITGTGAEFLTKAGQALQQFGFVKDKDPIKNTQAYGALMAQNVAKHIKEFGAGTGLSDADREYATKMAGGDITLDEKSIRKILDLNEKSSRNIIKNHNKSVKGIKSMIPLEVEEPPEYVSPKKQSSTLGTGPFADPEKERRYQEWKRKQGK